MRSDHRPYPQPNSPWVNFQRWNSLCFIHWAVAPEILRKVVPPELELDSHEGSFFIGIVPFEMDRVRPRFLPAIPGYSTFPELNVRTYVKYKGKQGVYFLSLDAFRKFFVWGGRTFFHLPYFYSEMKIQRINGMISYSSSRNHIGRKIEFIAQYEGTGETYSSRLGSLEEFLTERYCLLVVCEGIVKIAEIDHPKWRLQKAKLTIYNNDLLMPFGIHLDANPIVHYSESIDVKIWPLRKI